MKAEVMGDVRIIVVADDVQLFNIGLPAKRRRCQSAISVPMAITAPRIYLSRVFCPLPRVDTRLHVVEDDLHKNISVSNIAEGHIAFLDARGDSDGLMHVQKVSSIVRASRSRRHIVTAIHRRQLQYSSFPSP